MQHKADVVFVGGSVFTAPWDASRPGGIAVTGRAGSWPWARRRAARAGRSGHRGRRPGRRAAAARLPGRPRPPGDGRRRPCCSATCTTPTSAERVPRRRSRRTPPATPTSSGSSAAAGRWSTSPAARPTRQALDAVVPDRPVFLTNRDGHGTWVNTAALELAGIDASHPRPGRRPDRARGRRHRRPAPCTRARATARRPAAPGDQRRASMYAGSARRPGAALLPRHHGLAGRRGRASCSACDDIFAGLPDGRRARATCRPASSARCGGSATAAPSRSPSSSSAAPRAGRPLPRRRSVKIMQDGVAENFTAAMLEPYLDRDGCATAQLRVSASSTRSSCATTSTQLDAAGFQVHFHALGDRAVREALDARRGGPRGQRPQRRPAPPRPPAGRAPRRHPALRRARRGRQHPAAVGRPRAADGRADHPVPRRARARRWQYPFGDLLRAGARWPPAATGR